DALPIYLSPDDLTERLKRERNRRLFTGFGALAAVTAALAGLLIWALRASHEATRERDSAPHQAELATSRQLAASAKDIPAAEGDLALDLAVAARRTADTQQST